MANKEIVVLVPVRTEESTCIGCCLHRDHNLGAPPIDEGCNFRKLCGTGQFTAKLLEVETLTLKDLPNE